jgi:hypothetical protein
MAKRQRLIDLDEICKIPTLVVLLNLTSPKRIAFFENDSQKRKAQWVSTLGDVIGWCKGAVESVITSDATLVRVTLLRHIGMAPLDITWCAWGLLRACKESAITNNLSLPLSGKLHPDLSYHTLLRFCVTHVSWSFSVHNLPLFHHDNWSFSSPRFMSISLHIYEISKSNM